MASITVNWTPVITDSVNQEVQYKLDSSGIWISYATVSPMDSSIVINGLVSNSKYNIRIINNCVYGEVPSYPIDVVMLGCPIVTITPEREKINYTFAGSIENITSYIIQLISTSNIIIQTQTKSPNPTVSGVFIGLTPGTIYNVRIVVKSGSQSKICTSQTTTTLTEYCNEEISQPFTRDDCPEGYIGTEVIYTVDECTYHADTQEEADNLASADILANGQNYANDEAECVPGTFWNVLMCDEFLSEDCEVDETPEPYEYCVLAHTYSAATQELANAAAQADIDANGQDEANENGICVPEGMFCNIAINGTVSKTCEDPLLGTFGNYTYAAGQICASTQEEANSLAEIQWNIEAYEYVNTDPRFICNELQTRPCGELVLYNSLFAETPYNISYGTAGTAINKFIDITFDTQFTPDKFLIYADGILRHNTGFRGDIDQQDELDAALIADGLPPESIVGGSYFTVRLFKTWASNIVTINFVMPIDGSTTTIQSSCIINAFGNTERCGIFYSEVCGEETPIAYNYCLAANTYWAETLIEANALRDADFNMLGQEEANDLGECAPEGEIGNEEQCEQFLSEDCPEGYAPEFYEYCVPMNTYFAETLEEANDLALADILANGQNEANENGECTPPEPYDFKWILDDLEYCELDDVPESPAIYYSEIYSEGAFKNDCPEGTEPGEVEVLQSEYGQFISYIDQDDADQQAIDWVQANKQEYANENGECF